MKNVLLALFISALLVIHALIGGTRLLFSLPAYGLLALAAVLAWFHRRADGPRPVASCLVATVLMVAYIVGRAVASPVEYLWWPDFYMVIACALAYLLVALHFTGLRDRQLIVAIFIGLAAAEVLLALHQFTSGDDPMLFGFKRPPNGRRASGFLISPNHLAGLLEVVGVLGLASAFWSSWRAVWRILAGYVAVACFVGVAITGSRGGYLSSAFCLLVFFGISVGIVWAADRRRAMVIAVAGLIVLGGGIAGAVALMRGNPVLQERLNTLSDQFTNGRLDVRIYNWQATLDQIRLAPVFGTGSGTHVYYGRVFRRPQLQTDPIHAHSDYLELLAEYGIAGAVVVAFFVGAHLLAGVRRLRSLVRQELLARGVMLNDEVALQVGALCAVAALAVHSVVDFNLHIPGNALLMAFVFALLAARPALRNSSPAAPRPAWTFIPLPACGIFMLVSGISKLPGEYWSEQARKVLGRKDLDRTIAFAEKGLRLEARNPYLYFYLGEAKRAFASGLRVRGLRPAYFSQSVEAYRKSLAILPQDETVWIRLGQALDGLKDFENAETAFLTALTLDPKLGVLYAYYAAHLNQCGRFAEAEEQLRKGQELTNQNLARLVERSLDGPTNRKTRRSLASPSAF